MTFLIADIWTVSATQRAARIGSTGVLRIGWERKCCIWERVGGCTIDSSALSHTVSPVVRTCAAVDMQRSDAYSRAVECAAAGGRVFRALTFPRAILAWLDRRRRRFIIPLPRAARFAKSSARREIALNCESAPRCAVARCTIESDRFRQSAMARNCLFRCALIYRRFFSQMTIRFA